MSSAFPAQNPDLALDVFCGTDLVGRLAFDPMQDQFSFAYSAAWRQRAHRFQLSPHIPLDGEVPAVAVRRFIDNLLPEGGRWTWFPASPTSRRATSLA
ncbi:HipA N-terminal domain-containing protein [Pseudomonas sp.]|uniref:HipA N-terminal domain-containing protein n=1 Tax=Pseudomonas sp. TaxID=306 RepID=UPI003D0F4DFC